MSRSSQTSSSRHATTTTLLLVCGSFAAGAALATLLERRRRRRKRIVAEEEEGRKDILIHDDDAHYLAECQSLRQRLSPPRHSGFRVVALLLLKDGSTIAGANDEPAVSLGGALCAERAALLAYRVRYGRCCKPQITTIYIVSDHPTTALPPGCLCREYLYGHPAVDPATTRIVLQAAASCPDDDGDEPTSMSTPTPIRCFTLQELHPYPSAYARCRSTAACVELCQRQLQPRLVAFWQDKHSLCCQVVEPISKLPWSTWKRLVDRAQQAATGGAADNEHSSDDNNNNNDNIVPPPIPYGAAALVVEQQQITTNGGHPQSTRYIATVHQMPAQEYGCTQDAVCALLLSIRFRKQQHEFAADSEENNNHPHSNSSSSSSQDTTTTIQALVQTDPWGVPHAPLAAARSLLVEHPGYGEVPVLVLTSSEIRVVRAADLVPWVPQLIIAR